VVHVPEDIILFQNSETLDVLRRELRGKFRCDQKAPPMFASAVKDRYDLDRTVAIQQQDFRRFRSVLAEIEPRRHAAHRENQVGDLPKSWANAGAFSPLTLKSKLAHN